MLVFDCVYKCVNLDYVSGIIRHEAEGSTEAFYGQQAVYRVSIGNFVSAFHT